MRGRRRSSERLEFTLAGGSAPPAGLIQRNDLPLICAHMDPVLLFKLGVAMTAQDKSTDKPHPVVRLLADTFANWLNHRRELSEVRQLDTTEFNRIASDLRVTPGVLDLLVHRGPHAADELPKLLKALGIDQADLARSEPLVLRDMERVCAMCASKRQCSRDLAAGTSAGHYEDYCGNAPTIDGLGQPAEQ